MAEIKYEKYVAGRPQLRCGGHCEVDEQRELDGVLESIDPNTDGVLKLEETSLSPEKFQLISKKIEAFRRLLDGGIEINSLKPNILDRRRMEIFRLLGIGCMSDDGYHACTGDKKVLQAHGERKRLLSDRALGWSYQKHEKYKTVSDALVGIQSFIGEPTLKNETWMRRDLCLLGKELRTNPSREVSATWKRLRAALSAIKAEKNIEPAKKVLEQMSIIELNDPSKWSCPQN